MKIEDDKDGMSAHSTEGRQEFCWNCYHFDKSQGDIPCNTCFGNKPNGDYYCYKNWEKGVD